MPPTLLSAADTGFLVIDVQEKLLPLIPDRDAVVRNIEFLLDVAALVKIPVQATEQYPKGLGPTVAPLAAKLPAPRPDKVAFSCCAARGIVEYFQREARPKLLLAGIETHVCVQQTALDLLAEGFRVYVAVDAVAARHAIDHDTALKRMQQAGVILTTAEAAAFEWIGQAGTPEFKALSQMLQNRAKGGGVG
jgi:nicotinamidase-related amidase